MIVPRNHVYNYRKPAKNIPLSNKQRVLLPLASDRLQIHANCTAHGVFERYLLLK